MADFLGNLRMNNIFGGGRPSGMPDMNSGDDMNPSDVVGAIMRLRQQQDMDAENRSYRVANFQNNMNRRNANLDKIQSQPDISTMNTVVQYPDEAAKLLKARMTTPKNDGAMTEYQKAQIALAGRRLDVTDQNADDKLEIQKQDSATRQARAKVYEFKAKNPGMKIEVSKGGNFIGINPVTGETIDTGVSTGTMSEADKQEMIQSGKESIVGMQGDQKMDQINRTGEQRIDEIGKRIEGQKTVAGMRTAPESATQDRVKIGNAARQIMNTNPELAPFISFDGAGNPIITPPSTNSGFFGSSGPTADQYKALTGLLYGTATPPPAAPTKPEALPTPPSKYKVTVK